MVSIAAIKCIDYCMDKRQLKGRKLGHVFNPSSCRVYAVHYRCFLSKLTNLNLKTRPNNFQVLSHQVSFFQTTDTLAVSLHIQRLLFGTTQVQPSFKS